MQRMPAICAAEAKLDWIDWFFPPGKKVSQEENEKYVANWRDSAQSWAGESRTANLKGLLAAVPKFTAKGTVQRARATAAIALSKAEAAVEAVSEEKKNKPKKDGFGEKKKERSKAEEVAFRFTEAAEAWDAAAQATEAAIQMGWTKQSARMISKASKQTANIATAAELTDVAKEWRIAAAAWEGAALEMEGAVPEGEGQASASSLVARTPAEINSIPTAVLISLFVGSGVVFAVFHFWRHTLTLGEDALLATHS